VFVLQIVMPQFFTGVLAIFGPMILTKAVPALWKPEISFEAIKSVLAGWNMD